MASEDNRPLSNLVAQGWEVVGYAWGQDPSTGMAGNSVLLRRQKQHKLLMFRRRYFGGGFAAREYDV